MILAGIIIAAVINILAKSNNYNIKLPKNPNFEIRVRRCTDFGDECDQTNRHILNDIKQSENIYQVFDNFQLDDVKNVLEIIKNEIKSENVNKNMDFFNEFSENTLEFNEKYNEIDISENTEDLHNVNIFKNLLNLAKDEINNIKIGNAHFDKTLINNIEKVLNILNKKIEGAENDINNTILSKVLLRKSENDQNILKIRKIKIKDRHKRETAGFKSYFSSIYNKLYNITHDTFFHKEKIQITDDYINNYNNDYNNQTDNNNNTIYDKYSLYNDYNQNNLTNNKYNPLLSNYHFGYFYPENNVTGLYDPAFYGYSPYNYTLGYNNTSDTTTEMVIQEGCVLCGSFGCPRNYRRLGPRCVPK